ncbi:MAG: NADPH-dependent FMN reductase [Solirubrobacteraceae bacterium]
MARVLLISGSLRDGSTNTAALRTAQAVAPDGVQTELYGGMASLPHFNPDDDYEPLPAPVAALRAAIGAADAILICTPEYAGAMPGALKNLLEWTIGGSEIYRKPVAWVNVSGPAAPTGGADAHDSLRKVLTYAHVDLVEAACRRVPLQRGAIGADGLVADPEARDHLAAVLAALVTHEPAEAGA